MQPQKNLLNGTGCSKPFWSDVQGPWVCFGFCFVLRIACSGEKLPQVQGGRAAVSVLAELWGEEPSTSPAAAVGAKNQICGREGKEPSWEGKGM